MKPGIRLPEVTFHTRVRDEAVGGTNPFRWEDKTTSDLFAGKKVVVFSLPGAFTPTCSSNHLPRYEELYGLVRDELRRSGFEELIAAGVVITGGSAKMEGAVELAEEVFHMPVRLGSPQYVDGLLEVVRNPIHATGVGLLLYGLENLSRRGKRSAPVGSGLSDVWDRMKSWFQGQF